MGILAEAKIRIVRGGRDRLAVRVAGTGGRAIAMLHGLASSSRYWTPGVAKLESGHRLLMPDLLGFGLSIKPSSSEYTANEHVSWLHRTLAPLADGPYTLVGHSMGSILALQYAATHAEFVDELVLMSLPLIGCLPWGHRANGEPRALHRFIAHTAMGARLAGVGIRLAAPFGHYLAPRIQHDVPVEAARDALRVTAASYWRTLERVVYGTDVRSLVAAVQRPLLLIHGAGDHTAPLDPVRELAASMPQIRLEIIEGAGHNPYFSHTESVTGLIRDRSVERQQSSAG